MMSPILLHSRRNYGYDLLFTLTIILIHLTYIENAPARPAPPCGVTVPCNLGQKYGVPEDCFSYYECNRLNAMLEHKVCPGERYFDVNDLQCTYSISAVCASPCNTPEPTTVSTTPSPTTTPRATTQSTTNPSSTTPPAETPLVTGEMPVSDDTAGGKDPNAVEPPVDKLTDPPEILETIQTTVTPSPSTSSTTPSTTSTTQTPSPSTQPPSSTTSSHPGTEPGGHPPGDTETTTADSTTAVLPPPVQNAGLSVAVICIIIALVVVLVIVVAVVVIFVVVRKRKKDRRHNVAKDQPTIENPIYRKKQPLPDNNHDYRFSRDSKLVMGQQKKKPLLLLLNNNRDQNGGSGIYAIPRPQQPKAQKTYIPASIRDKRRAPPPPNPFTMKVDGNGYHTPMSDIEEDDKLNDSGQIEMTTFGDTSIPGQHTSDLFSSDSDDDDFDESFDNTVEDDGKVGSRASKSSLGDRLSKGDRASKSSPGDRASKTSSVDRLSKASSVDQGPKGNSGDRGSKTDSQNRMSGAPENKALLNEPPSLNSSFASRSSKRQAPPPPNPFGEDFESTENLDEKNPFSDTADDDLSSSDKHDTHSVDRAEEQTELLDKGERRGDSSLSEPQTDMNRSYSSFDSQQSEY